MPEYVRVHDQTTDLELTTLAQEAVLNSDVLRVLKKPAVGPDGTPLPAKKATQKRAAVKRTATKKTAIKKTAAPSGQTATTKKEQ